MEFRLLRIKEIKTFLKNEVDKTDIILKNIQNRNTIGLIDNISAGITMSSGFVVL